MLDGRPRVLDWGAGYEAVAPDGTRYALLDEHARGEKRWWAFTVYRAGDPPRRASDRFWLPEEEGRSLREFDGSHNIQTVRNRAERHARRFHTPEA